MNATTIVGWKYDADLHCPGDAVRAYPNLAEPESALARAEVDSEGNPLSPAFADEVTEQDVCGDCFGTLL